MEGGDKIRAVVSTHPLLTKDNTQLAITDSSLSLRTSCSAGFPSFPRVEVQRCGANSENQGGGWLGAGEEVLGADGEHAAEEGRSC